MKPCAVQTLPPSNNSFYCWGGPSTNLSPSPFLYRSSSSVLYLPTLSSRLLGLAVPHHIFLPGIPQTCLTPLRGNSLGADSSSHRDTHKRCFHPEWQNTHDGCKRNVCMAAGACLSLCNVRLSRLCLPLGGGGEVLQPGSLLPRVPWVAHFRQESLAAISSWYFFISLRPLSRKPQCFGEP